MTTKTICITGASSGFGEACARRYAKENSSDIELVLIGRRKERLTALADELAHVKSIVYPLDVRDNDQILKLANFFKENQQHVDILINNAGLALGTEPAHKTNVEDWDTMIDTNIRGLAHMTHALLPMMIEKNSGHIINIGSIAGSWPYPGGNAYCASKAFVEQFSRGLRADLLGTNIRVSNIAPGFSETEFSIVRMKGDKDKADALYEGTQPLTGEDVADIIYFTTQLAPHININSLEVMPTCQAWGPLKISKENG